MRNLCIPGLAVVVALLLLVGCTGRTYDCESTCWPGPRLGPTDPCLCREPQLEGPCPEPETTAATSTRP